MARITQPPVSRGHRLVGTFALAALVSLCSACDEAALDGASTVGSAAPGQLSARDASAVLARVGDKPITLGDFAAVLERMDQFQRLKYQTSQGRMKLLEKLIDAELLAQEARKRGLHKRPEVRARIRQILREAELAKVYRTLPPPGQFKPSEVAAYYEKHKQRFVEPERRRVSAIVLDDEKKAEAVLKKVLAGADGKAWGKLFYADSITAPEKLNPNAPPELAGDLGLVSPPGDVKGDNPRIPDSVRRSVFTLENIGDVADKIVAAKGRYYVVRLSGRSKGHTRSLAEAERSIRVSLLQDLRKKKEDELEAELRKRFPVRIDQQALRSIKLPSGVGDPK
ncbi:MAG: peptidyl-prolyl cis-trans isomerase [Polyangiaceae bacterium]